MLLQSTRTGPPLRQRQEDPTSILHQRRWIHTPASPQPGPEPSVYSGRQAADRRRELLHAYPPYPCCTPPPSTLWSHQNLSRPLEGYLLARTMGRDEEVCGVMRHLAEDQAANSTACWNSQDDSDSRETLSVNLYRHHWPLSPLPRLRICLSCCRLILIIHQDSTPQEEVQHSRYRRNPHK